MEPHLNIRKMADISKCSGIGCSLKENCYRYTAVSSEFRQSYLASTPVEKDLTGNDKCDYYWPNNPETEEDEHN